MVRAGRERQTDDPFIALTLHRYQLPVIEVTRNRYRTRRSISYRQPNNDGIFL
jgi:hypothetical protein